MRTIQILISEGHAGHNIFFEGTFNFFNVKTAGRNTVRPNIAV